MIGPGGCDEVSAGETGMEVASQCGKHIAVTTDDLHKPMRDMMTTPHSQEEKQKWFDWFNKEWDKKGEI